MFTYKMGEKIHSLIGHMTPQVYPVAIRTDWTSVDPDTVHMHLVKVAGSKNIMTKETVDA